MTQLINFPSICNDSFRYATFCSIFITLTISLTISSVFQNFTIIPYTKQRMRRYFFFRYADRFAQLEHRGMRYRRNIRLKIHEYRMGKERIKAGESWPEKKKKKTLRSIRRVEIELQSGRKEISEGRCGRFRCNDAPGGEGGLHGGGGARPWRYSKPGQCPEERSAHAHTIDRVDQPGWPRSGAGAR